MHRRQKPDAFDQSDSGVALRTEAGLTIKIGLSALLLGLQQFGFGGKPVIEPRLRRLLHRFCTRPARSELPSLFAAPCRVGKTGP